MTENQTGYMCMCMRVHALVHTHMHAFMCVTVWGYMEK